MAFQWLPAIEDWDERLRSVKGLPAAEALPELRLLATSRMDFTQVGKLDRVFLRFIKDASVYTKLGGGTAPGESTEVSPLRSAPVEMTSVGLERVRVAVLGSATTSHLAAGIRVAGLRRGLLVEVYQGPYGMYSQELMDAGSGLYAFRPEVVLLALDARHLAAAGVDGAMDLLRGCWRVARAAFGAQVLQQTVMPVFADLLGENEHRLVRSPASVVAGINERLRVEADAEGVDLVALDRFCAVEGLGFWYQPDMWHRSKHEVHPAAAALYGDHVARVIAAGRGKSAKCLVLDLDNTLWGGVIGDDGLDGIVLGQGSGSGEAYVEFQRYALGLSRRGVILAVCSKNDEANALEVFERHPEMVLRRGDIACFVANWTDKATNLREIAARLNIGLDALVFVDDNPVERALIRRELPMVHVPEMPEDPAGFVGAVAAAGYFEGLRVTEDDRARGEQYQANAEREAAKSQVTDMASYLESLRMVMTAGPVDAMSLARVTQLINKTNQFNLTTLRLSEAEVAARMRDEAYVTLQVRLADRFGDNGLIAVVMAKVDGAEAEIEEWLMSCRVLGRRVEEACLNVLAEMAAAKGVRRLVGVYVPSEKNAMVREMYPKLGFAEVGENRFGLELAGFEAREVPMQVDAAQAVMREVQVVV